MVTMVTMRTMVTMVTVVTNTMVMMLAMLITACYSQLVTSRQCLFDICGKFTEEALVYNVYIVNFTMLYLYLEFVFGSSCICILYLEFVFVICIWLTLYFEFVFGAAH